MNFGRDGVSPSKIKNQGRRHGSPPGLFQIAALCRDAATENKFTQKPVATAPFSVILIFPFHPANRRLNRTNGLEFSRSSEREAATTTSNINPVFRGMLQ
jgi:hypothetical protein